ncbi:hypothetical protein Tco_1009563, partial [Tanacetum coccineum]
MVEEPVKPIKKKVQIMLDEEIVLKLQAEIDEEERITIAEEEKIDEANIAWDDIQAKVDAAKRAEENRNKPPTKTQQKKTMITYLKNMEDKEEVTIDAIPLVVKSLRIVDRKIHKEGKKSYYQIVRADARYGSTRPVEDLDLVLWNDLKNMFEPHVEDTVWRNQQVYKVLEWKLYDSCGGRIVGIKSFLMLFGVTAALIDVNAAQSKLVLLENFNENYSKCLRLLYKVNAAEGVNAASEEVSTAEL